MGFVRMFFLHTHSPTPPSLMMTENRYNILGILDPAEGIVWSRMHFQQQCRLSNTASSEVQVSRPNSSPLILKTFFIHIVLAEC